jgi:hypothetical protein
VFFGSGGVGPMKKKPSLIVSVFAVVIGAVLGNAVVGTMFRHSNSISFDKSLVELSKKMNTTLPILVDKDTRLDATMAGPGYQFIYLYTLVNLSASDVDRSNLVGVLRPKLINGYKTSPSMAAFRSENVELHYEYRDKDGKVVVAIAISPRDF